ncbi:unnamed protein product [Mytilus edulis]|uniref:Uncharacterized protein n=1 Tax=Mytilus edulis TaxID=6550 RepID=A0A8S3RQY0_MYTED|nr:unnamed protein product [Mytilus edulis]
MKPPVTTESQVEPPVTPQQQNQSEEQAKMDIETMLKSNVDLHDKEEYATLLLWDFAGDEEFYHTHQTFLSPDAIYLVVTKLNEADDKKAKEMFQLWMNSIHCYCSHEEQEMKAESNTEESEKVKKTYLKPPVILVGSYKDEMKISGEYGIEDTCKICLDKFVSNVSEDACRHLSEEYFVSNTKDDENVFQRIRLNILDLARSMKTSWNKQYPVKFIQLEKFFKKRRKSYKFQ